MLGLICELLHIRGKEGGGVLEVVMIDKLNPPFYEQLEILWIVSNRKTLIQNTMGWDSYNPDQGVTFSKKTLGRPHSALCLVSCM